jgi:hypothetical protein
MEQQSLAASGSLGGPSTSWQRRVMMLLLAGHSLDRVIGECSHPALSRSAISEFGGRVLGHPLFAEARLLHLRLSCREWHNRALDALAGLRSEGPVATCPDEIDRDQFLQTYYTANRAVFLPQLASRWPAVTRWTDAYLIEKCGQITVQVMVGRASAAVKYQNTASSLMRTYLFSDYITLVQSGPSNDHYLVSRNRFFSAPGARVLLDDVGELPFVNTRAHGDGVKLLFGPAQTITPLHHDDKNNVIVQIRGRKVVRLFPPCVSEYMDQTDLWYAGVESDGRECTGRLPEHVKEVRLTLTPGDALFIPVGWWHAIKAEDVSITMAFIDFGTLNDFGVPL